MWLQFCTCVRVINKIYGSYIHLDTYNLIIYIYILYIYIQQEQGRLEFDNFRHLVCQSHESSYNRCTDAPRAAPQWPPPSVLNPRSRHDMARGVPFWNHYKWLHMAAWNMWKSRSHQIVGRSRMFCQSQGQHHFRNRKSGNQVQIQSNSYGMMKFAYPIGGEVSYAYDFRTVS